MAGIAHALALAAALTASLAGASTVELFQGARIVVPEDSDVAKAGTGSWLITLQGGCNDSDVQALAVNMPNGTEAVYSGHPDTGGLCLFVMTGTKAQVMEELASHNVNMSQVIAEADEDLDLPETFDEEEVEWEEDGDVQPWGLDRIDQRYSNLDGEEYESPGKAGKGVHVFVFDTGIFFDHSEFEGRAVPYIDVTKTRGLLQMCKADGRYEGANHSGDDDCSMDFKGHGTHCAGTIAGRRVGVAPQAVVKSVKVLPNKGSGKKSWGIEALDKVLCLNKPQGKIVSMSLGGKYSEAQNLAVTEAVDKGLVVVVSAGNSGRKPLPDSDSCTRSPASASAAITVGSTDDEDYRSEFSAYGTCVDIFAPGSNTISANGLEDAGEDDYRTLSGTSMACPHVAGAAALLLSENKHLSPYEVRKMLFDTSSKGFVYDPKNTPNRLLYVGDLGEEDDEKDDEKDDDDE